MPTQNEVEALAIKLGQMRADRQPPGECVAAEAVFRTAQSQLPLAGRIKAGCLYINAFCERVGRPPIY